MKSLFAPLAMKIAGVIGIAMLVYIVLLHLNLAASKRSAAKWQSRAIETQVALDQTVKGYREKAEAARRADLENKQRVEAEYARIQSEKTNVQKELASVRARLERLRSAPGADPRSPRTAGVPSASQSPSGSTGADRAPVMDEADKLTCEINTLVATGWREWWERVRAVER